MRVRILQTRVYGGTRLIPVGQIVEVDDSDARQWIGQGFMEAAPEKTKTMVAPGVDPKKTTRRVDASTDDE